MVLFDLFLKIQMLDQEYFTISDPLSRTETSYLSGWDAL